MSQRTLRIYLDKEEHEGLLNRIPQIYNKFSIDREIAGYDTFYLWVMQSIVELYDGATKIISDELYNAIADVVDTYISDFLPYDDGYAELFTDLVARLESGLEAFTTTDEYLNMFEVIEGLLDDYEPYMSELLEVNFDRAIIKVDIEI